MIRMLAAAFVVVTGLAAGAAYGSEAAIRQAFQAKFSNASVESVTRTPFAGIYEVVFDGQIAYTDEKLNFVFFGNLVDVRGGAERNLTRERSAQLNAATLSKAAGDQAFKRVRGNGKRMLYTFEDPNCAWCKKLHGELNSMTNLTVYTFLIPILGPDSVEKSKAVWCAKDRAKAWDEAMQGIIPSGRRDCAAPIEKNLELSQRFGIRGTPAIYLGDGRQVAAGFVPASELDQALNSIASK